METLLQYLREHQDTFAMGDGRRDDSFARQGKHTKPLRKYVSVYRIDGEPIIPPLMTTEKRRQMRMFKEKAIKIEKHLKQSRQLNKDNDIALEFSISIEPSQSSITHPPGYISPRFQPPEYYNAKINDPEESMMMLRDIIKRHSGGEYQAQCVDYFSKTPSPSSDGDKLKNLQISEVLIYDNTANKIIQHTPVVVREEIPFKDIQYQLMELERKANLNYVQPQKPSHLLLSGLNERGGVSIPTICLNPPTPIGGSGVLCEDPIFNDSSDILQVSEDVSHSLYKPGDGSSDESFNNDLAQRDPSTTYRRKSAKGMHRSEKIHDLKAYNTNSNVISKIQQFEAIGNENSLCNTSSYSCPDKIIGRTPPVLCTTSLNRSSTIPSIKLAINQPQNIPESNATLNPTPSALLRSSSFTLDAPSKALIEHMKQQNTAMNTPIRKAPSPSRLHYDTVESKAKRVQKVEPKLSSPKILQKTAQQKPTSTVAASVSYTYSSKGPSSTHNLYKSKKSPYDSPNCSRSVVQAKKPSNPPVRKSPSSSMSTMPNGQKLNKSKSAATVKQIYLHSTTNPPSNEKKSLSQVDKIQKEKFQCLLKQQEEEQIKLKHEFQMQQKVLMEQLNREVEAKQVNADDHTPRPIGTSTQRSETELSRLELDLTQNRDNISENNSATHCNTTANNTELMHGTNITENPCDESLVPSLSLSTLSSIDHSNISTSFGSSTAIESSQKSNSLPNENNVYYKENGYVRHGSGYMSTSRRRLFPQDYALPNSRDKVACASFSPKRQDLDDSPHYHQPQNQSCSEVKNSYVGEENSAKNRRPISLEGNAAHAAATKINAYVRGFLTRRLFKTEQIQRIVQTIHDTLVFVLNLHLETCENPMEANSTANIKLKARLLQQLVAATRTLHLVFFQTSMKERMDIIARDRKRIRTKLLALKRQRTPRIAG